MTESLARARHRPDLPQRPTASMGRVARGSTANLAGAVVMGVSNFALTIAVTRGLSKPVAGVFFSATSLFLLATSVGQLGTSTGLVYFISRCRALGTTGLIGSYLRAALRPVLLTAVLMGAALFLWAPQVAAVISPDQADRASGYLRALAFFIPLAGLENVALAATRGMGTMRANAVVEQIGRPLLQLLLVGVVLFPSLAGLLTWAWAFAYAPAAVVAWFWWQRLHRRGQHDAPPPTPAAGTHMEFWRFSGPRALTSVAQMAMQRLDIVLVGALSGAVNAAIYAAATRFIVAGQMGSNAISQAAQPRLAETIACGDHETTKHIYQTSTAWLMAITWPMFLSFSLFSGPLLHVFGKGYGAGTGVLLLLSLSMLVATGCGMVDMVLSMAGHTTWNLANAILALGVLVGLDLWLIPSQGVLGAAIGWAAAILVRNLAALSQVAVALRLQPIGRATAGAAGLSIACFAIAPGAVRLILGTTWLALVVALALGTSVYVWGLWRLRRPLQLGSLRRIRRATRTS